MKMQTIQQNECTSIRPVFGQRAKSAAKLSKKCFHKRQTPPLPAAPTREFECGNSIHRWISACSHYNHECITSSISGPRTFQAVKHPTASSLFRASLPMSYIFSFALFFLVIGACDTALLPLTTHLLTVPCTL